MIYILIAALIVVFTVLVYHVKSLNASLGWGLTVALIVIAAIRLDTGTDTKTYSLIWDATPSLQDLSAPLLLGGYLEPGFLLVNSVLHEFSENSVLFFLTYAGITMLALRRGLDRLNINQAHALLVYFCVFFLPYALNGMRQAVAMSLFVLAVPEMNKRRAGKIWVTSLVAMSFHLTGALVVVAYYLRRILIIRIQKLKYFLIGISVLGIVIGHSGVVSNLVFKLFPSKQIYHDVFDEGTSFFQLVSRLVLAGTLVLFAEQTRRRVEEIRDLLIVYLFGLAIYLVLSDFNVLATRFNMFFRVLEIICIPMIYRELRGGRRWLFAALTFGIAFATLLATAFLPDYEYQTVF